MRDEKKTKKELIDELTSIRKRMAEVEVSKDRRRAEEALRESENRYRTIFQTTGTTMLIIEEDMTISLSNRGFENLTGYEREEIEGKKKWTEFIEKGDLEKMITQHRLRRIDPGIAKKSYEFRLVHRDGCVKNIILTVDMIPGTKRSVASLMDITDRRQAEEALRDSKEQYRFVVENLKEVVFRTDAEGHWTFLNSAWAEVTGFTVEESLGTVFLEFVYPEDRELNLELFRPLIGRKKDYCRHEIRYMNKNGGFRWIEVWARLTLDEKGNATGTAGTLTDITDRKQAEEALRESEARYELITENMSDTVWLMDMNLKTTWCSPSVMRTRGYTFEEIKALPVERHVTPESIKTILRTLSEELTQERLQQKDLNISRTIELEFYRKDGCACWSEARFTLLRDSQGNPIGLLGVGRDITERKRVQDALRESEEKHRAIIEDMQEGYHEVDLRGNFTFFNGAFQRIIGYGREELMGMSYKQYSADEESSRNIFHAYNRVYRTGEPLTRFEWDIIRKDGVRRSLEVSASLIKDSAGRPHGFRGIITDITERKRADAQRREMEERLQRAEKMELMGILAGGVAHDLNNVLGIVIGYSEMLLMDANQPVSIRPSLEKIMNAGQKAAAIVQDLLTLARRGVSGTEVLNLNKIIADCRKSPEFEKLSSYHPTVEIMIDLEPRLFNVSGSSVHLGKTLFNLVSNASEAMPRGGVLTIKTANRYLAEPIQGYDEVREGDYVVLSVSDTGEGIAAADLKRIFEPFYTKKVMGRSGTGLGLAVVWGTVKDHKGYINVESEEGKGSVFTIYFPVTRDDVPAEAAAISISEYVGKGESILVVDDVEEQRHLAAGMLRKLNYNASSVASGEEAIAYLKEHQTDLMVLDMIMDPGMDGLDTYRKILEIHPKQKAIVVSGFSETERVIKAQALGAGVYLRKPYIIEKLGFAVRRELERK